jgi:hypothetical protein
MMKSCEAPPMAEATAKPSMPVMKIRLRPNRSARRPPRSSRPPKASAYAVTTLAVVVGEAQVELDFWQGDVDHGEDEHDHELAHAAQGQDPPAPGVAALRLARG